MKRLTTFISLTVLFLLLGCSVAEFDRYPDNAYNLPNNSFKTFCLNAFDKNGDGSLTDDEVRDIRKINCSGQSLDSVHGIGIFPALDTLICDDNDIKSINFSELTHIHYLSCKGNLIEEMDLRDMSLGTLICNPMNDHEGNNVLQYIYLRRGQDIDNFDAPDDTYIIELP